MQMLRTTDANFGAAFAAVCDRNSIAEIPNVVHEIIDDIRANGIDAVLNWSAKLDQTTYANVDEAILVPDSSWLDDVDPQLIKALQIAAERIENFATRQKPEGFEYTDTYGNRMGSRWLPMERVGLYVPGGTAAYPSSVLMNAIPARVAGVDELWVLTPPTKMKAEVKAAATIAGVDKVIAIGGVQAVAMAALGAGVDPVDIIVGPGNRYVAAAKQQLFGQVAIDMIAGPSEIMVLADGTVPVEWLAADLLSQAEHDVLAVCGLVTTDAAYGEEVMRELLRQANATPRSAVAVPSVNDNAFCIVAADLLEMVSIANRYAPEHLELAIEAPEAVVDSIRNAGSIFVGKWTPEAVGDYVAGPNHVLPTSGSARFFSPLGVDTFMKRSAFTQWTEQGLRAHRDAIVTVAECEELVAHADSVRIRLD